MKSTRLLTMLFTACALGAAATAEAACTISTTAVSFGTYNVFSGSPNDATGQVTFRCSPPLPSLVTIQLDKGGSSSFNPRQMRQGTETLNYNLYLDSTRTTIWGDGTGGTQTYTQTSPPASAQNANIYGRIPAAQDVSAGTYSATVTATIFF